jgi:hypothetical protein
LTDELDRTDGQELQILRLSMARVAQQMGVETEELPVVTGTADVIALSRDKQRGWNRLAAACVGKARELEPDADTGRKRPMTGRISNGDPQIEYYYDASTGHVSKHDTELLDQNVIDPAGVLVVYKYPEGYWIYTGQDTSDARKDGMRDYGYTEELIQLFYMAGRFKCNFLRLDADGMHYDDLPVFNW